jgi:hypothetical protein
MKKLNLTLITILIFIHFSKAQNTFPSTGNVGIGTNTPSYPLTINGGINSNYGLIGLQLIGNTSDYGIKITNTAAGSHDWNILSSSSSSGLSPGAISFADQTVGAIRMLINSSGNVGIGTTNPIEKFTVNGAIAATGVAGVLIPNTTYIDYCAGCNASRLLAAGPDNNTMGTIQLVGASANASYYKAFLTAIPNGNVGIGTTTPTWRLNVDPQGEGGILIGNSSANNGGYTGLILNISASQNGHSYLQSIKSSGSTWGNLVLNPDGGNMGVGVDNPVSTFQVDDGCSKASLGDASGSDLRYGTSYIGFNAARNGSNWTVNQDGANNGGAVIYSSIFGDIYFSSVPTTGASDQTLTDANIASRIQFHIAPDGTTYAKAIRVQTQVWSDYVFKPSYHLPSLSYIKRYIDQNRHLPDMPTTQEVVKDGINVAEILNIQTKKIEELTLYLIEKDKQVTEQQKKINELEAKLNALIQTLDKH